MNTNNEKGRQLALAVGIYFIVKSVLNMILGGSIKDIIISLVYACLLYTGFQFVNYAIAILVAIVVLTHLKGNLSDIGANWIYLLEAVVDVGCCVILCTASNVKEHFTNKWSELINK